MSQKILNRADIVTVFQQVRGKTVPKGMATNRLVDSGQTDGPFEHFAKCGTIDMVPAFFSGARINRQVFGWKQVLPSQLPGGHWVFAG